MRCNISYIIGSIVRTRGA